MKSALVEWWTKIFRVGTAELRYGIARSYFLHIYQYPHFVLSGVNNSARPASEHRPRLVIAYKRQAAGRKKRIKLSIR